MASIYLDGAIIIMMARRRGDNQDGASMAPQNQALIRMAAIGSLIASGGVMKGDEGGIHGPFGDYRP